MMTILGLLIVISVIVFLHELGHFLAARWAGARVDVFSIGFGRAIIKWKDRRGTEWRIAWLPLGGFVSIYGQDQMFERKKYADLPAAKKKGHYLSLPAYKQAIVIFAGVFFNFLTAFVIYTGLFVGTQTTQLAVVSNDALALRAGDRIMQVNGVKVADWGEMIMQKELHGARENNLVVLRGAKIANVKMPAGKWGAIADATKTETHRNGIVAAVGRAGTELWAQSKMMVVVLKQMITGERSGKQLGGLITIGQISGQALSAGAAAFLALIALLSINLGVLNLFPLPVLDGGYLLILGIEAVVRRRLGGRMMDWIMRAGWGLLIALMAFAMWNDIARIFHL
ncbi:MAG: RIP metalloprotease [Rickettsiales bacterium]|nr:RIP metalloprotease [Rickettsiales bacterium]